MLQPKLHTPSNGDLQSLVAPEAEIERIDAKVHRGLTEAERKMGSLSEEMRTTVRADLRREFLEKWALDRVLTTDSPNVVYTFKPPQGFEFGSKPHRFRISTSPTIRVGPHDDCRNVTVIFDEEEAESTTTTSAFCRIDNKWEPKK
jgi:hypothetical protein